MPAPARRHDPPHRTPMADATPFDVHVLPHTHWDREWYLPAGRFRQRLVALVDELLDAPPEAGESFLLDGQAVVLDDYLTVRPERRAELAACLAGGVLEAGPWYVLADELIPGAEALVRNLLAGRAALAALGAEAPPVLYCPDSFGHPAILPTLAQGFGLGVVVLWRGYGGQRWPAGDTARWRAPDGSEALLSHLPPDGYEYGSALPVGHEAAVERWARLRETLVPRARLGLLLVQNGADHHARQRELGAAVDALARAAAPHHVARSSLRRFAGEVVRRAAAATLPVVEGELRDSYGYTWTLQGTFATRAAQKRRHAAAERLLVREAEPWAALGAAGGARRGHLLRAAWRALLLCQPHDTLCGCSTDEVARAMDCRLDDVLAQAAGVRDDSLLDLAGHDPVESRERRAEWRSVVTVRNAAARPRGGVAEVELLTFLQDVPVGPGSGGAQARVTRRRGAPASLGDGVPLQILDRAVRHDRVESPRHYPDDDLVEAARAVAWVPAVAGYGTRSYQIEASPPRTTADDLTAAGVQPVRVADNGLDNGLLRVQVGTDGRIALSAGGGEALVPSLLRFEDVGDAGDLYTHSPVGRVIGSAWFVGAHTVHRGPLRGEVEARYRLRLPAARLTPDEVGDDVARAPRSPHHLEMTLAVRLVLDAGAAFLRVRVSGDNRARDHRLRVVVATGVDDADVWADAAFGPVRRVPLAVPSEDTVRETPPPTAPLHRFVSLFGAGRGATVYSDGLAEYEATPAGEVAITLVRAVGELSRGDLRERPGHAGWPVPTPEAQSLGPFEAEFALLPHGALSDGTLALVERTADDVLLPLTGTTLRSALTLPSSYSGVELQGAGLAFSTLKESEDGRSLVLRCVNVTEGTVEGSWQLGVPFARAWLARLDETPLTRLAVADGRVPFVAPRRAVMTILVEFA